jgi:hypothetical protein
VVVEIIGEVDVRGTGPPAVIVVKDVVAVVPGESFVTVVVTQPPEKTMMKIEKIIRQIIFFIHIAPGIVVFFPNDNRFLSKRNGGYHPNPEKLFPEAGYREPWNKWIVGIA